MTKARDLADGTLVELNVDSNTLAIDSTNNRVGIGTASPTTALQVVGTATVDQMNLGDSEKAYFGTGNDLEIYHDGSNSYIVDSGTGNLKIAASQVDILGGSDGAETMATFVDDGAATLYYDNAAKLATNTSGVTITGTVTADGLSLGDSEYAYFGASNDLQIYHDGSNSYISDEGAGTLRVRSSNQLVLQVGDDAGGWENAILANNNAGVELRYNNLGKLSTSGTGVTVTGTVTADGLSLGDSEYAYFGASNDLQIYHDGSNSLVQEVGTGSLLLCGNNLALKNGDNSESYVVCGNNGAVTLYYDNSAKLATATGGAACTGDFTATGNITAYYSDDRLKTNLGKIENALEKVESLEGFYYEANEKAQELGYKAEREVGISAQSVEKIMPEVVAPAPIDEQYLTVRYERLVPLLIESIKELSAEVKRLKGK